MFASGLTQIFCALPLPPGPGFEPVVRGIVTPLTGMFEVACTTVVPATVEVIVAVQLALGPPPVYVHVGDPTNEPGPLTIDAVAVCGPASMFPPGAFTVMVNT